MPDGRVPIPSMLFVCLGNICRSPMAKALLAAQAKQRGLSVNIDSCGTGGWHAGEDAHPRTREVLERHGVALKHSARKVRPALDFEEFDLLIAMDRQNAADLLDLGAPAAKVLLLRSFDARAVERGELDVPDPYGHELDAYEAVYEMVKT
ncbi:MAG: low molecular weight protein-tyrosine-phosphatase, partial [Phycisphaerales bacterium]